MITALVVLIASFVGLLCYLIGPLIGYAIARYRGVSRLAGFLLGFLWLIGWIVIALWPKPQPYLLHDPSHGYYDPSQGQPQP